MQVAVPETLFLQAVPLYRAIPALRLIVTVTPVECDRGDHSTMDSATDPTLNLAWGTVRLIGDQ